MLLVGCQAALKHTNHLGAVLQHVAAEPQSSRIPPPAPHRHRQLATRDDSHIHNMMLESARDYCGWLVFPYSTWSFPGGLLAWLPGYTNLPHSVHLTESLTRNTSPAPHRPWVPCAHITYVYTSPPRIYSHSSTVFFRCGILLWLLEFPQEVDAQFGQNRGIQIRE